MDRFHSRYALLVLISSFICLAWTTHACAASPPVQTEASKFDETYGRFGLSLGFQFNFAQTPAPVNLYKDGIGGLGEISYGVGDGFRILGGGGYIFNSPHVSPPQSGVIGGVSSSYEEGYIGGRLAMNPVFPTLFLHQPWVPYIRTDVGGVGTDSSGSGLAAAHSDGFLVDVGLGVEGRAPEFPVGFFAEVRSQWFFFGSGTVTVLPVIVGSTFYF